MGINTAGDLSITFTDTNETVSSSVEGKDNVLAGTSVLRNQSGVLPPKPGLAYTTDPSMPGKKRLEYPLRR